MILDNLAEIKGKISVKGKILAIDVGMRKFGYAISDEDRVFAFPRGVILLENENILQIFEFFASTVKQNDVELVVIGFPFGYEDYSTANFIQSFILSLDAYIQKNFERSIVFIFWDEAGTTSEIRNVDKLERSGYSKKRYEKRDSKAASLILSSFLAVFSGA